MAGQTNLYQVTYVRPNDSRVTRWVAAPSEHAAADALYDSPARVRPEWIVETLEAGVVVTY